MTNPIKTKGTQFFNVPNTDEGKLFLALARRFANQVVVSPQGRGKDRLSRYKAWRRKSGLPSVPHGRARFTTQSTIVHAAADWFAVYLHHPER